jgi:hypothetical protein
MAPVTTEDSSLMRPLYYRVLEAGSIYEETSDKREADRSFQEIIERDYRRRGVPLPESPKDQRDGYRGQPIGIVEVRERMLDRIVPVLDTLLLTEEMRLNIAA